VSIMLRSSQTRTAVRALRGLNLVIVGLFATAAQGQLFAIDCSSGASPGAVTETNGCISTGASYGNNEACTIQPLVSMELSVQRFSTAGSGDWFATNCVHPLCRWYGSATPVMNQRPAAAGGPQPLDGQLVAASGNIRMTWVTDGSGTGSGFTICGVVPTAQPTPGPTRAPTQAPIVSTRTPTRSPTRTPNMVPTAPTTPPTSLPTTVSPTPVPTNEQPPPYFLVDPANGNTACVSSADGRCFSNSNWGVGTYNPGERCVVSVLQSTLLLSDVGFSTASQLDYLEVMCNK
jgi:hypothetical protein